MAFENVTVVADGFEYSQWKAVTITAALNEASREFVAVVAEPTPDGLIGALFDAFPLLPNTKIEVYGTGQLIFTGYVTEYGPSYDDAPSHDVRITARSLSQDYVDTSVDHDTGFFEDRTDQDIAEEIGPPQVPVTTDTDPSKPLPNFQVRPTDSPHTAMMRILPDTGKTMKGGVDGGIVITKPGQKRHATGLIEGVNIKRAEALLTSNALFKTYKVRGQNSVGTKEQNLRPEGVATDPSVKRERTKIFPNFRQSSTQTAQQQAEWAARRARGFAYKALITVAGWREFPFGPFWEPGFLVYVFSPWLKLNQDMVIEKAVFSQADAPEGTTTVLSLVDPRAYNPDAKVTSKSGSEWKAEDWGFSGR